MNRKKNSDAFSCGLQRDSLLIILKHYTHWRFDRGGWANINLDVTAKLIRVFGTGDKRRLTTRFQAVSPPRTGRYASYSAFIGIIPGIAGHEINSKLSKRKISISGQYHPKPTNRSVYVMILDVEFRISKAFEILKASRKGQVKELEHGVMR